jgi:peptidoglycan/LPS O-acetylase OafA/YrhL
VHARSGRFPLFDSLRAIAALSVLATHAAFYSIPAESDVVARFTARLDVGVTIFFLISGFLLYRPFVAARLAGEPSLAVGAYAWRRFLRIVPAYWVALTVTVLWLGLDAVFTPERIPIYYGYLQIYWPETIFGGLPQAWTLCVEVSFYAFLPLWAFGMRWLGRSRDAPVRLELAGLLLLALVSVAYKAVLLAGAPDPDHANAVRGLTYLPAFLDQFAIGMALAVVSVALAGSDALPRALAWIDARPGLAWAGALAAFLTVSVGIGLDGRGGFLENSTLSQTLARHWLYALVGLGLLLPAVFGDQTRGLVRHVLANRLLLYLGLVSYGIYLWQQTVIVQLERWELVDALDGVVPAFAVYLALGVVGATAIASLSWFVLERPVLDLKRLFPARGPMPGEPAARERGAFPPPDKPAPAKPG